MSGRLVLAVALLAIAAVPATAQRNCRKGIPCGNTCISATRTCRVGSSSPSSDAGSGGTRSAGATAAQRLVGREATRALVTERADSLLPWVAPLSGGPYYASACEGAQAIRPGDRAFFRNHTELERIGYPRAEPKQEKCSLSQLQEHERRLAAVAPR